MNEIDRFRILVRHLISLGIAQNQKELGKYLGYENESYFSQIVNKKVPTPKDLIEKIKSLDERININWLLTGEGEMLSGTIIQQNNQNGDNIQGNSVTVNKAEGDYLEIIKNLTFQLSKSQEQISKSQEQMDRLITIIENKL